MRLNVATSRFFNSEKVKVISVFVKIMINTPNIDEKHSEK